MTHILYICVCSDNKNILKKMINDIFRPQNYLPKNVPPLNFPLKNLYRSKFLSTGYPSGNLVCNDQPKVQRKITICFKIFSSFPICINQNSNRTFSVFLMSSRLDVHMVHHYMSHDSINVITTSKDEWKCVE